jgi:hypothetical protein
MGSPTPATGNSTPNTFQPSSAAPQSNSTLMPTVPIPDNNSGSAPRLLDPQSRTTSTEIIGPANVTHAVFNTAERGLVFHPVGYHAASSQPAPNDGWSGDSSGADNWQSGDGR